MHEQSETVMNKLGKWVNVFGQKTPKAGQVLKPKHEFEKLEYDTMKEAVEAAKKRSELGEDDEEPTQTPRRGRTILTR